MISEEIINGLSEKLSQVLVNKYGFCTQTMLDKAVLQVIERADEKYSTARVARRNDFSLSTLIRAQKAMRGEAINGASVQQDIEYIKTKALTTGSTPGSYLVPTIQADEIIGFLETGGIARAAGARIWPMNGIQSMNVPTALGAPVWVWMAQNSVQTPTDPNLGQMAFTLKERRALIAVPNQLLAVSVPAFDVLLSMLLGISAAAHEDTAFFATTTVSGGPTALLAASGITTTLVGGSANGGSMNYADLLTVLWKASAAKAKAPFVWFASPRTMYQRIMGMLDLQSRPLYLPTLSQGLFTGPLAGSQVVPVGNLMGYPIFVSPYILENEAYGSGTNQSHLIFMNPSYAHIGADGSIEVAVSLERFFDANQTAVRALQHEDFGFAPAAGITVLTGVN